MVAQMLNNPNAMKMVLNYLTKQNLKDSQKKWDKMSQTKSNGKSKTKKTSNKMKTTKKTTKKPKVTTTTKKAKTKSPILQITQIKRKSNDKGKNKDKKGQQVIFTI